MFHSEEQTNLLKKIQTADRNLSPHASAHTLTHLFAQNQVSLDHISTNPKSLASAYQSISIIMPLKKIFNSNPVHIKPKPSSFTAYSFAYSRSLTIYKVLRVLPCCETSRLRIGYVLSDSVLAEALLLCNHRDCDLL